MEEKLDFSLPEKKPRSNLSIRILLAVLLILVVVASANLFITLSEQRHKPEITTGSLTAEQTKQLAAKLAERNLYEPAARAWQDYLRAAKLTDIESAKMLFQIGVLLEKARLYAEAIEYYYRSEIAAKLDELEPHINAHIKDCFEKLGKFSALRYELMERTSLKKPDQPAGKITAEIGAEKITDADLDAIIENDIDNQLTPLAAFMTDEQLKEQKKKLLEQYKNPQARHQYLQNWLAEEILYRQALQEGLTEKTEVKKQLDGLGRSVLSQHLLNQQLAEKIHITESDLQMYYSANKNRFVEPARVRISHILIEDEQQAKDLIARIKNGEDFGTLAKEYSKDESTKGNNGRIDIDVTKGSYIPVIGDSNELNEKIFAAESQTIFDEPVKTEKGWEIIKVEEKQAERQRSFDEVRQQVTAILLNQKRQDVQQDYMKQMMDKYNVIIHSSVFTDTGESEK